MNNKLLSKSLLTLGAGIGLLTLSACDSNNGVAAKRYDQIDRVGRPAINTLLIHQDGNPVATDPAGGPKDSFNLGTPDNDSRDFAANATSSLTAFRSLDDNADNDDPSQDAIDFIAVLLPDVLIMDLGNSGASTFLGVELGIADSTGGRALTDDVVDAALGAVLFPGAAAPFVSDNVDANDVAFDDAFPYLAPPN